MLQPIGNILGKIPDAPAESASPDKYEQRQMDIRNATPGSLEGYDCEKCLNRGGSYVNGNTWRECECMKIRKAVKLIEKSGLKPLIDRYTFDNYQTPEVWQKTIKNAAEAFLNLDDNDEWFFGVFGQTGSGKTHICTAMAGRYLRRCIPVNYMIWNTEVKRIKATANDGEPHLKEIRLLQTVEVLYIDDLFKCKAGSEPSDADVRLAFEIINARYNARLITLISSEFTIDGLRAIDSATAGRINEACGMFNFSIEPNEARNYRWKK